MRSSDSGWLQFQRFFGAKYSLKTGNSAAIQRINSRASSVRNATAAAPALAD
jgi:hypothetical protein